MLLAWSITAGRGGAGAGSDGKTGGTIVAENQNSNRKNENVRRANRIIQTRSFVLMILMGVVMFVLLFFRLFDLQITRHEELQGKAVNQQTRRTVVTANRGTIYDAGGNILAISSSAETIILSPLEIDNAVNDTEDPVSWTKESLAAGLAEILGKDASAIRKRMDNVKSQYEVLQLRADEDTAAKVRSYVDENKIAGVHLVADTKRYYPYGSLAAQVIGFVGDENTGLYGLEAYYEEELEGQSGLVISSKDQAENDMLYTYEQYFAAKNGSDLTLTLDTTIQYYLEKGIESMVDKFSAANGASGIETAVALKNAYAMAVSLAIGAYTKNDPALSEKYNAQAGLFYEATREMSAIIRLLGGREDALFFGAGDLYVTVFGGRTRRLGTILGSGVDFVHASEILKGVTLESVAIIRLLGKFFGEKLGEYPLMQHIHERITENTLPPIPWDRMRRDSFDGE